MVELLTFRVNGPEEYPLGGFDVLLPELSLMPVSVSAKGARSLIAQPVVRSSNQMKVVVLVNGESGPLEMEGEDYSDVEFIVSYLPSMEAFVLPVPPPTLTPWTKNWKGVQYPETPPGGPGGVWDVNYGVVLASKPDVIGMVLQPPAEATGRALFSGLAVPDISPERGFTLGLTVTMSPADNTVAITDGSGDMAFVSINPGFLNFRGDPDPINVPFDFTDGFHEVILNYIRVLGVWTVEIWIDGVLIDTINPAIDFIFNTAFRFEVQFTSPATPAVALMDFAFYSGGAKSPTEMETMHYVT